MPKNASKKVRYSQAEVDEAKAILEQATSRRGAEWFNAGVQDAESADDTMRALAGFKKECPKEYARITAAKPEAKKPAKGGKEVRIAIVLREDGTAEYEVQANGYKVPDGFKLSGTRDVNKAKGIVTNCVRNIMGIAAPTHDE